MKEEGSVDYLSFAFLSLEGGKTFASKIPDYFLSFLVAYEVDSYHVHKLLVSILFNL